MTRTAASKLAALALAMFLVVGATARADSQPQANDVTKAFRDAGVTVSGLQVIEVGGIVVIRGRTADKARAEQAGRVAQSLGYTRVANLVQLTAPVDDAAIARRAERELAIHRSLDGCKFQVDSEDGVVRLAGTVRSDMQRDLAVELLRNIDGVRDVQSELNRF